MRDNVAQALEPWKKASDFSFPIFKMSEMAGEKVFIFFLILAVLNDFFPQECSQNQGI